MNLDHDVAVFLPNVQANTARLNLDNRFHGIAQDIEQNLRQLHGITQNPNRRVRKDWSVHFYVRLSNLGIDQRENLCDHTSKVDQLPLDCRRLNERTDTTDDLTSTFTVGDDAFDRSLACVERQAATF